MLPIDKDIEAAKLCASVYSGPNVDFDHWFDVSGVVAGLKFTASGCILSMRGSEDTLDFERDLDDVPVDTLHIGRVHAGFYASMPEFRDQVSMYLRGAVTITGHSLGAARACILAGELSAMSRPVGELILFGCPRPGFSTLASMVQQSVGRIASYRNGNDPVTDVPWLLGWYKHVIDPVNIGQNKLNPIDAHFIANYQESLNQIIGQTPVAKL